MIGFIYQDFFLDSFYLSKRILQLSVNREVMNNTFDVTTLTTLGLGWLMNVDWVVVSGVVVGALTLVVRAYELKEKRRCNDLREKGL